MAQILLRGIQAPKAGGMSENKCAYEGSCQDDETIILPENECENCRDLVDDDETILSGGMSENECAHGGNCHDNADDETTLSKNGSLFCCKYCDKVFQHSSSLSRHVKSKHSLEDASSCFPYFCQECSER